MSSTQGQLDFIAFTKNKEALLVIKEVFSSFASSKFKIHEGGVKYAIDFLSKNRSPKILIVDISDSKMPASDMSALADVCEPGIQVIALGQKNDVGVYRDLMNLGVADYIVLPLLPEILLRAIEAISLAGQGEKVSHKEGKIIVVSGARGGVGTTTIATNLAYSLSKAKNRRVVILDLNLHTGTAALYLDVKPNHGLHEALENPDRFDEIFIERLFVNVNERLQFLGSQEALTDFTQARLDGLKGLLEYLVKKFHYIIIDVPRHFNPITIHAIENANIFLLIMEPSLASIRDAVRLKEVSGRGVVGRRFIPIVSKKGAYQQGEVSNDYIEKSIGFPVSHTFSYDPVCVLEALNQGKIVSEEPCDFSKELSRLVDDISGIRVSKKEDSFLGKLKDLLH